MQASSNHIPRPRRRRAQTTAFATRLLRQRRRPGVFCEVCPTGTDCAGGATIERLPLKPAFFQDQRRIDVRRCPTPPPTARRTLANPRSRRAAASAARASRTSATQADQADGHVLHEVRRRRLASLRSTMCPQRATRARAAKRALWAPRWAFWRALWCLCWCWCPFCRPPAQYRAARRCQRDVLAAEQGQDPLHLLHDLDKDRHHLLRLSAAGRQEDPREPRRPGSQRCRDHTARVPRPGGLRAAPALLDHHVCAVRRHRGRSPQRGSS